MYENKPAFEMYQTKSFPKGQQNLSFHFYHLSLNQVNVPATLSAKPSDRLWHLILSHTYRSLLRNNGNLLDICFWPLVLRERFSSRWMLILSPDSHYCCCFAHRSQNCFTPLSSHVPWLWRWWIVRQSTSVEKEYGIVSVDIWEGDDKPQKLWHLWRLPTNAGVTNYAISPNWAINKLRWKSA